MNRHFRPPETPANPSFSASVSTVSDIHGPPDPPVAQSDAAGPRTRFGGGVRIIFDDKEKQNEDLGSSRISR